MPDEADVMRDAPAIEVAELLKIYSKRNHHPVVCSPLSFRLAVRTLQETMQSKRHRFSLIAHY